MSRCKITENNDDPAPMSFFTPMEMLCGNRAKVAKVCDNSENIDNDSHYV
jgi:hypothetical protein